jgi:cell division protein FtsN
VIVLSGFITGYFTLKSTTDENTEIKSFKKPVLVEESAKEIQSWVPVLPKEEGLGIERAKDRKKIKGKSQQSRETRRGLNTVQVGAFRDATYAETFKTILDKKGFNAYITLSESKGDGRLYKVCIGRFSNRKEAEVLSMKIKKAEGLHTFVIKT